MTALSLPASSKMLKTTFTYGVATASFQIEGGIDNRLPCIWDTFCATPGKIVDGSDGSIACDHFNKWQEDIELISSLGVDAYRLSISWPRLIQKDGELNAEGVEFYLGLLKALKDKNIKAYVTLYHWDLPQHIEDQGGWLSRDTAYKFADYADKASQVFGDLVYSYATLNEPFCSAFLGYEDGVHAPGLKGKENGRKAAHHLLLGHGLAMEVLQRNNPSSQNGIVLNFTPGYSKDDSPENLAATDYANQYHNDWYIRPIMEGKYPDIINDMPAWQKPEILPGDMEIISQKLDFLGINFYTRAIYQANSDEIFEQLPPPEPLTDIGWEIYPTAFTELLTSLNEKYTLPPLFITENGAAMADKVVDGVVNDQNRFDYYQSHLNAVNDAIEQGVNVEGYFAWSLMDNFEWAEGYLKRFGIVYVDYDTQKRTIKNSGLAYRDLIQSRS